jgi:hypothetical protein
MSVNKFGKLYFTTDFSESNVKKLQSEGWTLRNAAIVSEQIELANEYGGNIPQHYKDAGITVTTEKQTRQHRQEVKTETKE